MAAPSKATSKLLRDFHRAAVQYPTVQKSKIFRFATLVPLLVIPSVRQANFRPPFPPHRWGGIVLQNSSKEQKKVPEIHLVSPGDSLERGGCRNESAVRERRGVSEWKGDAGCK